MMVPRKLAGLPKFKSPQVACKLAFWFAAAPETA
jgi:hypothetical protein